ncbi:MAG: DUF1028 domain-containing protein [Alphaproteobacteria bacterium]|nr:DUF1028 domain-containing protein [Alphaproteobacteria bacterium]
MTFSIAALCPDTGRIGLAVASSSPAVAARCAHLRAGIGAVASQNVTDPRLGPRGLDLMALGAAPAEALAILRATGPHIEHRQLALLDRQGRTAAWSGTGCLGVHATAQGKGVVSAGNLLANPGVPQAIVAGFLAAQGDFGGRVLAAMKAGLAAGGEAGPIRSIGMLVVADVPWPVVDLRVDWHDAPIAELERLWAVWRPQADAYVTRALNPGDAPSFGVPGNL